MYKNIFVPLDGSEFAEVALDHAIGLAQKFDATVTIMRVVHPMVHYIGDATNMYDAQVMVANYEREKSMTQTYLEEKEQLLKNRSVAVDTAMSEGVPISEKIFETAEASSADLIVMSTHGRSGFRRLLFGSVAEDVLRQSEIPVLLIRNQE